MGTPVSRFALVIFLFSYFSSFGVMPADAAIYSYTDSNGVVHFTNVPNHSGYKALPHFRTSYSMRMSSSSPSAYDSIIREAASHFRLDPHLIKAVISAESNFNPRARSPKGALGLMQLMPDTARDMDVVDIFDPKQNIYGGSRYLHKLYRQFNGDLELVLASYNAGPERVLAASAIPDIVETKQYVRKVLSTYRALAQRL